MTNIEVSPTILDNSTPEKQADNNRVAALFLAYWESIDTTPVVKITTTLA